MKASIYIFTLFVVSMISLSFTQDIGNELPDVKVETLDNKNTSLQSFIEKDQPTLLCMWTTWSSASIRQLDDIERLTKAWKKEGINVKVIAINMDKANKIADVNAMVTTKNWDFQVLVDKDENLRKAMDITTIPYSIIVENSVIEYAHVGFEKADAKIFKKKLLGLTLN